MEQVLRRLGMIERQIEGVDSGRRYIMRVLPYRTVDNVIAGIVVTFVDITQIARAEEKIGVLSHDLRNRLESLETLLDLVPVGILIAEDGNGDMIRANRRAMELTGRRATDDKLSSMPAVLPLMLNGSAVSAADQPLMKAMRTGKTVPAYEARIVRATGGGIDVMMSANPLFDESGKVRGAIGAVIDISSHKNAERNQERLLHELQHRVKNILATVTALTSRMMRSSHSLTEFASAFQARLQAMARTHELLASHQWGSADLEGLLEATLSSYGSKGSKHLVIQGEPLELNANAAATLGQVFFELASNAAKYGALTTEQGRVDVSWHTEKPGTIEIVWKETGGPKVKEPLKRSFGTTFIQQSLEYELGGTVDLQFKHAGLECVIRVPLSRTETTDHRLRLLQAGYE